MPFIFKTIRKADIKRNKEELQKFFTSITIEQMFKNIDINPENIF